MKEKCVLCAWKNQCSAIANESLKIQSTGLWSDNLILSELMTDANFALFFVVALTWFTARSICVFKWSRCEPNKTFYGQFKEIPFFSNHVFLAKNWNLIHESGRSPSESIRVGNFNIPFLSFLLPSSAFSGPWKHQHKSLSLY